MGVALATLDGATIAKGIQGVANATPTTLRYRLQAINGLPTVKRR